MKVHLYEQMVSADAMSAIHGGFSPQKRLYIPNMGVIGYGFYKEGKIDGFFDSIESIQDAEDIIKSKKTEKGEYLKELEIPDGILNSFLNSVKSKNQAEKDFQAKGKSLIDLIESKQ